VCGGELLIASLSKWPTRILPLMNVFTRGVTSGCGKRRDQSARRNLPAQE
jgi:hypothetical protein